MLAFSTVLFDIKSIRYKLSNFTFLYIYTRHLTCKISNSLNPERFLLERRFDILSNIDDKKLDG